jgi:hypothetical protein
MMIARGGTLVVTPTPAVWIPLRLTPSIILDAAQGTTDAGSGALSAWADQSGNAHDLVQGTGALRPTIVPNIINGEPVIRFGPTAADKYMSWAVPWAQGNEYTFYAVVKYVQSDADYQNLLVSSGGGAGATHLYLGAGVGFYNKPMAYGGAGSATWGSALVTGTVYVIRFTANHTTDLTTIRVNRGSPVSGNQSVNLMTGNWVRMGLDIAIQDPKSDLAYLVGIDGIPSADDDTLLMDYFTARYATP